ncbi:MAG: adenosylmethionine decarboxylase [Thermocladium sp.]|jgi:S-adenosylmethionine decarboxylase
MSQQETYMEPRNTINEGVIGWHVFGEIWGVDPNALQDEKYLRSLVIEAANVANMHLAEVRSWRFGGGDKGGVSVIALVLESHIAIHTWPDHSYATIDVYTCGGHSLPWKAFDYLIGRLRPERFTKTIINRSSE